MSVSQTRHSNVLVLLLSCAPGPPTPVSIPVRASLHCSVIGVVHRVGRDLQFLGNFSHGIDLISQNKNRLMSFRRKYFVFYLYMQLVNKTLTHVNLKWSLIDCNGHLNRLTYDELHFSVECFERLTCPVKHFICSVKDGFWPLA